MPPVPADVIRCRLVFDLNRDSGPVEQAVMGWHMRRNHGAGNPTDWAADVQETATKLVDKWIANVTSPQNWASAVHLNRAEVYHLNADTGKTMDKGVSATGGARVWNGSSPSASLPWEVAMVVSLYGYAPGSFDPLAKFKRGRFYLPPFAVGAMGTGNFSGAFSDGQVQSVGQQMNAFLNDIHKMQVGPAIAGGGDTWDLGILSRTRVMFSRATTWRVGHAPDTQRRRGKSVPELYLDGTILDS